MMDAPDRYNGQRDKRTNERTDGQMDRDASLCPSVCLSFSYMEFDTNVAGVTTKAPNNGETENGRPGNDRLGNRFFSLDLVFHFPVCHFHLASRFFLHSWSAIFRAPEHRSNMLQPSVLVVNNYSKSETGGETLKIETLSCV